MTGPALTFQGVSRHYGPHTALDGIDLDIARGQRVALIGPSGSGKSTILALANGALRPSEGTVAIDGVELRSKTHKQLVAHRKCCGLVPQGGDLVEQLSVHDNVIVGLLPRWPWYRVLLSRLRVVEEEQIAQWLSKVNLASRQTSRVGELSGGEKRRVAIARGLIGAPNIILADEPTSSLDPHIGEKMAQLIFDQAEAQESTLLFATHWVSRARRLAQRIIGLRSGRVVLDAPAEAVTDDDIEQLYAGSDERH
ncbi:MAG: ATP-binding cassette domain-containing protein [Polyangiaceae bacterium]